MNGRRRHLSLHLLRPHPGLAGMWTEEQAPSRGWGWREHQEQQEGFGELNEIRAQGGASFSSLPGFSAQTGSPPRLIPPGQGLSLAPAFIPALVNPNVFQCLRGELGPLLMSPLYPASGGLCGSGCALPTFGALSPQSILTAVLHPDASLPSLSVPKAQPGGLSVPSPSPAPCRTWGP